MNKIENTLNRLFVDLFNHILYLEERNIQKQNIHLTIGEIHLLENIERSAEKTVGNVAKLHRVTLGTATVGIDKLVKKGYVLKERDVNDKRVVRLTLTDKATKALAVHTKFHKEMIDSIINDFELDKQEELVRALKNVETYFENKYNIDQ